MPTSSRKLLLPPPPSSPPRPSPPVLRLFTQLTAKEDMVSVFIPFTHSCPSTPAPPHFPALCSPPPCPLPQTPPHGFKTNYNQLLWVEKDTSINDEPQGGRGWERILCTEALVGLTLPFFQESQGLVQTVGGCTATRGPQLWVTHSLSVGRTILQPVSFLLVPGASGSGRRGWGIHLCDDLAVCLPPPQRPSTTASVQPSFTLLPRTTVSPWPHSSNFFTFVHPLPSAGIFQPTDPISVLRQVLHCFPITCKHGVFFSSLAPPNFTFNSKANYKKKSCDKINQ